MPKITFLSLACPDEKLLSQRISCYSLTLNMENIHFSGLNTVTADVIYLTAMYCPDIFPLQAA